VFGSLGSAYTIPGALLWLYGLARLARSRLLVSQAALITALLAGPILFLAARPVPDPASGPQAAAWGLCALGLAAPFLWGLHRAGVKAPAARGALVLLLPLSLAARLPSAARNDVALETRAENLLDVLSPGALLWDSVSPGAFFHARYVAGVRPDVRVARRPGQDWARAEYRRRHPTLSPTSPYLLSPDLFFFDAARETGPDNVFTDSPDRLPAVDPATGLAVNGRFPEDGLPSGPGFQFFPSDAHRLVDPGAQLPLMRLPLWGSRAEDPEGAALARFALSRKFDQYGLAPQAEEEAWAALADDPGLPEAHRRLGEAALARGDGARAAIHFRRALRRAASQPDLWALAARAEWSVGDRGQAAAHARAALDLDPSLEDTRRALAESFDRDGKPRTAADEWRILMNRRPEERLYVWSLAKSEKAAGRPEKARAALREYLLFPLSTEERDEAETFEKSIGNTR
jgi:tetratricopeptide (TPR) repeat protein